MGGKGSGGARVGAGRKPKDRDAARLAGSRQRSRPVAVVGPVEPVARPDGMDEDIRRVWDELEPLARAARTLTPATVGSFRDLCQAVVVRDELLARIRKVGWDYIKVSVDGAGVEHEEYRKNPLASEFRGWEQRVEAGRARFRLAPVGKEIAPDAKPDDPFDEFDEPATSQ